MLGKLREHKEEIRTLADQISTEKKVSEKLWRSNTILKNDYDTTSLQLSQLQKISDIWIKHTEILLDNAKTKIVSDSETAENWRVKFEDEQNKHLLTMNDYQKLKENYIEVLNMKKSMEMDMEDLRN